MKKRIISLYLFALGGAWLPTAFAQQAYTLDQCIDEVVANNVRMKNAANNLAASRHERSEAFTKYFPSMSASGSGFAADKGCWRHRWRPAWSCR